MATVHTRLAPTVQPAPLRAVGGISNVVGTRQENQSTLALPRVIESVTPAESRLSNALTTQMENAALRLEARMDSAVRRVDRQLGEVGYLVNELKAVRCTPGSACMTVTPPRSPVASAALPRPSPQVVSNLGEPGNGTVPAPIATEEVKPDEVISEMCKKLQESSITNSGAKRGSASDAAVWKEMAEIRRQFQALQTTVDSDTLEAFRKLRKQTTDLSTKVDVLMSRFGQSSVERGPQHPRDAPASESKVVADQILATKALEDLAMYSTPLAAKVAELAKERQTYQEFAEDQLKALDGRLEEWTEEVARTVDERIAVAVDRTTIIRARAAEAASTAAGAAAVAESAAAAAETFAAASRNEREHAKAETSAEHAQVGLLHVSPEWAKHAEVERESLRKRVLAMEASLLEILERVSEDIGAKGVAEEMESIRNRLYTVEASLGDQSVAEELTLLRNHVRAIEGSFDGNGVQDELELLRNRVRAIEGSLSGIGERAAADAGDLLAEQAALDQRLRCTEEGFEGLKQSVQELVIDDELAIFRADAHETRARLATVEDRLGTVTDRVATLARTTMNSRYDSTSREPDDEASPNHLSASTFSPGGCSANGGGFERLAELEQDLASLRAQARRLRSADDGGANLSFGASTQGSQKAFADAGCAREGPSQMLDDAAKPSEDSAAVVAAVAAACNSAKRPSTTHQAKEMTSFSAPAPNATGPTPGPNPRHSRSHSQRVSSIRSSVLEPIGSEEDPRQTVGSVPPPIVAGTLGPLGQTLAQRRAKLPKRERTSSRGSSASVDPEQSRAEEPRAEVDSSTSRAVKLGRAARNSPTQGVADATTGGMPSLLQQPSSVDSFVQPKAFDSGAPGRSMRKTASATSFGRPPTPPTPPPLSRITFRKGATTPM